jgi:hypothetical protein
VGFGTEVGFLGIASPRRFTRCSLREPCGGLIPLPGPLNAIVRIQTVCQTPLLVCRGFRDDELLNFGVLEVLDRKRLMGHAEAKNILPKKRRHSPDANRGVTNTSVV